MSADPHVQTLKVKNVIAMEPVNKSNTEFTYVEPNGEIKRACFVGDKKDNYKEYAAACGLIWDNIDIGEGTEPCKNFKEGKLFMALRGPLGTRYVDFRYFKGFTRRDGESYAELINGVLIKCAESMNGNEMKVSEAKKVADSLPGYWENGFLWSCAEKSPMKQVEVSPIPESVSSSARKKPMAKEKKKKPQKQSPGKAGKLTQDVIGAVLLEKEIQSGKCLHVQDMDQKSLDYKRVQCSKKAAIEQIGETFFDILMQCEMLSS